MDKRILTFYYTLENFIMRTHVKLKQEIQLKQEMQLKQDIQLKQYSMEKFAFV